MMVFIKMIVEEEVDKVSDEVSKQLVDTGHGGAGHLRGSHNLNVDEVQQANVKSWKGITVAPKKKTINIIMIITMKFLILFDLRLKTRDTVVTITIIITNIFLILAACEY